MPITQSQLKNLVALVNGQCIPQHTAIKTKNDTYRIICGDDVFFLKTYTKVWYGDDIAGTGYCVNHEATAWAILLENGLPAPEVVLQSTTCDNPLQRPFLMTRALPGRSFTNWLKKVDKVGFDNLLRTVGDYLRQMHDITFAFPGYLSTLAGPEKPPSPSDWQHRCWTADERQRHALKNLDLLKMLLSENVTQQVKDKLATMSERLSGAYQPPKYTHGD